MDQKLDVAIHEAGHIIVAYNCGCKIEAVSISDRGGVTKFSSPKGLDIGDLIGIGLAGWAVEEAAYYANVYFPLLKIFESFGGLLGVSIFTSIFGHDSRVHHRRLHRMVERARKDIIDIGHLLQLGRVEWLPDVVFEMARPRYFDIIKELNSSMYLLLNQNFRRYYESVELKVRTLILERKEAVSRQFFSTRKELNTVVHMAKAIHKKKRLSSPELTQLLSNLYGIHPGR